uniref:FGE-sulfatase domain-containing protein n=1 Tax=Syphacia muris TaxID=451379 RepID=A0A0N5ATT5_9BILA
MEWKNCQALKAVFDGLRHLYVRNNDEQNCDCRDWYGGCRRNNESWIDDDTWYYSCNSYNRSESKFLGCKTSWRINRTLITANDNRTINGFWYSCDITKFRIKYEQEAACVDDCDVYHVGDTFRHGYFQYICLESGKWITGCFYQNETKDWVLMRIGETRYNGLVKHVCDKYSDYPGRVQYYAQVRDDIPFKTPQNKGINQNLPLQADNRLKYQPVRWLHETASYFTECSDKYNVKIRYLPPTVKEWSTAAPYHR